MMAVYEPEQNDGKDFMNRLESTIKNDSELNGRQIGVRADGRDYLITKEDYFVRLHERQVEISGAKSEDVKKIIGIFEKNGMKLEEVK